MSIDLASFLFIGVLSTIFAGVVVCALCANMRGRRAWLVVGLALLFAGILLSSGLHSDELRQVFVESGR
jgi:hypothetical protein